MDAAAGLAFRGFIASDEEFLFLLAIAADEFVEWHGCWLPAFFRTAEDFVRDDDLPHPAGTGDQFAELAGGAVTDARRGGDDGRSGDGRQRADAVVELLLQLGLHPVVGQRHVFAETLGMLANGGDAAHLLGDVGVDGGSGRGRGANDLEDRFCLLATGD